MSLSTTFRSASETDVSAPEVKSINKVSTDNEGIEVPFLDYKSEHKKPFCADFFELGEMGNNEVFADEINTIENYFKSQIEQGKMDNKTQVVREKLKSIEKMVGYDKSERTVVRMSKLAAYIKFLEETDHINSQSQKYA